MNIIYHTSARAGIGIIPPHHGVLDQPPQCIAETPFIRLVESLPEAIDMETRIPILQGFCIVPNNAKLKKALIRTPYNIGMIASVFHKSAGSKLCMLFKHFSLEADTFSQKQREQMESFAAYLLEYYTELGMWGRVHAIRMWLHSAKQHVAVQTKRTNAYSRK